MIADRHDDGRVLTLRLEGDLIDLDLTIGGVTVPPPLPLEPCELRWIALVAAPAVLDAHAAAPERRSAARRPWANRSNGAGSTANATAEGRGG